MTNPKALQLRFHAQTAGSTLTAQQPDTNIARVAIQALSAVLGGAQSLHTNGRDEALALPTEEAARIALRTQQIIADEAGVANTVDPAGGAWAIEAKTDAIEAGARRIIETIDRQGGVLAAIESGRIQRDIQDAAYATQQALERGDDIVVGVNRYARDEARPIPLLEIDPQAERRQAAAVAAVRQSRDGAACATALEGVDRRRARWTQSRAADHRRGRSSSHARRNCGRDAARLWRIP